MMGVTIEDFNRILDVLQSASECVIRTGEQHAPIVTGIRVAPDGTCAILSPKLIRNEAKADLVRARNVINLLLSRRLIDVGAFACESWVAEPADAAEERAMSAGGLQHNPKATSALVIMLYSRDEEHCVINPIEEGPPRRMIRGKLDPKFTVGSGRLSMHGGPG